MVDELKLWCGGWPTRWSKREIWQVLDELQGERRKVTKMWLLPPSKRPDTGDQQGQVFLDFTTKANADELMRLLDGMPLGPEWGTPLRCQHARARREAPAEIPAQAPAEDAGEQGPYEEAQQGGVWGDSWGQDCAQAGSPRAGPPASLPTLACSILPILSADTTTTSQASYPPPCLQTSRSLLRSCLTSHPRSPSSEGPTRSQQTCRCPRSSSCPHPRICWSETPLLPRPQTRAPGPRRQRGPRARGHPGLGAGGGARGRAGHAIVLARWFAEPRRWPPAARRAAFGVGAAAPAAPLPLALPDPPDPVGVQAHPTRADARQAPGRLHRGAPCQANSS